jgi:hypothetical protein
MLQQHRQPMQSWAAGLLGGLHKDIPSYTMHSTVSTCQSCLCNRRACSALLLTNSSNARAEGSRLLLDHHSRHTCTLRLLQRKAAMQHTGRALSDVLLGLNIPGQPMPCSSRDMKVTTQVPCSSHDIKLIAQGSCNKPHAGCTSITAPVIAQLLVSWPHLQVLLREVQSIKGSRHIRWYIPLWHHAREVVQQGIVTPTGGVLDDLSMILLQWHTTSCCAVINLCTITPTPLFPPCNMQKHTARHLICCPLQFGLALCVWPES